MFIVIYRPHNLLNLDTQYIGPFPTWEAADDALCDLPPLGVHINTPTSCNPGVKFTAELCDPTTALENSVRAMEEYGHT